MKKIITEIQWWFSFLGAIVTVILAVNAFRSSGDNQSSSETTNFLGLNENEVTLLVLATLFVLSLIVVLLYKRALGYDAAFEHLTRGFSDANKIDRMKDDALDVKQIVILLQRMCTEISTAFYKAKGHHCGVSIKLISGDNDSMVYTWIRDDKSISDGRPLGQETIQLIENNTDYASVYSKPEDMKAVRYYVQMNLPWKKSYKNSRIKEGFKPSKNVVLKLFKWGYYYRSTIVVPIMPIPSGDGEKNKIEGILCLDSSRRWAFNREVDLEIMKGIADGLYTKIPKIKSAIKKANKAASLQV